MVQLFAKTKFFPNEKRVVILNGVSIHIQIGGHSRCGHIPECAHGKVII